MINFKKNILGITLAALSIFALTTFAEVHKWKDADGKIHYGDRPEIVGTPVVKVIKPSDDQQQNARRLRLETERVMSNVEKERAIGEANKRKLNMELRMQSEREKREEAQRTLSLSRGR